MLLLPVYGMFMFSCELLGVFIWKIFGSWIFKAEFAVELYGGILAQVPRGNCKEDCEDSHVGFVQLGCLLCCWFVF